jgi:acetyltransferase-like isoleucine patch superfamily enzyme
VNAAVFRHPLSLVETERIGDGTRIWAFAHVLAGAQVGRDCNICDHVFVENDVIVGDRVTVKSGVQLWNGVTLEDDVFVGPNATFTNDPFPRSKRPPATFSRTLVRRGASIGANATILPGVVIGQYAMIGAGTVVTVNVPAHAVVTGNPGTITGYTDANIRVAQKVDHPVEPGSDPLDINGAAVIRLPTAYDLRGSLVAGELPQILPFEAKRFFVVFDVPSRQVRGEHAHQRISQFLVCLRGSCSLLLDDGGQRAQIELNAPTIGVVVPPLVWSIQYRFSPDAILLVLASGAYDPDEYIRDYDEFQSLRAGR